MGKIINANQYEFQQILDSEKWCYPCKNLIFIYLY